MNDCRYAAGCIFCLLPISLLVSGCVTQQAVSYREDIEPIFNSKCLGCHLPPDGAGYIRTGLNMQSYDSLMNGTVFGTVIIPGDSKRSLLNKLVEGRAGALDGMPPGTENRLTVKEIELIKHWVDQGALYN
jgi:hypothetical protein